MERDTRLAPIEGPQIEVVGRRVDVLGALLYESMLWRAIPVRPDEANIGAIRRYFAEPQTTSAHELRKTRKRMRVKSFGPRKQRAGGKRTAARGYKPVMIDLNAITRTLLHPAICLSKREHKVDAPTIQAVHDKTTTMRQDVLKRWLQSYGVFQGLEGSERLSVVTKVLEIADENGCNADLRLSHDELFTKFDALHKECCKLVRPNKDGSQRDLTSLTSKALWCCYPNAVPLYDRFTQHSVWLISRLAKIEPPSPPRDPRDRYHPFAAMWFKMYDEVLPIIEEADLQGYPYKVRIFDKILWIAGEPNYNRDSYNIGLATGDAKPKPSKNP